MLRILWLLFLLSVGMRLVFGRWPWELLRLPPTSSAEQRARALLGLSGSLTRKDILDAHRRLLARVHPDRGGTPEQVHEANAARDLLLAGLAGQDKAQGAGPDEE